MMKYILKPILATLLFVGLFSSVLAYSSSDFKILSSLIIPIKDQYKPGENITVYLKLQLPDVQNSDVVHERQYVEVAILPRYMAKQWFGQVSIVYEATKAVCDPLQPNFAGTWVERLDLNPADDPWEVNLKVKLTIPYPKIRIPPTGEKYWVGDGEYVIIVYSTNGCWEDLAPHGQYKVWGWAKVKTIEVVTPPEEEEETTTQNSIKIIETIESYIMQHPIIVMFIAVILLILLWPTGRKGGRSVKVYISSIKRS